ncbi:hypothetical protein WG936_03180 [Corynebacterium sp. H127]|uniref:hypothetical protein n=1 Tax=Corynebacterium sp. H127 TaxID=3133418 RepID=UPI0030ADA722
MTNMFPSMHRGGEQPHAPVSSAPSANLGTEPMALRVGYWWLVVVSAFAIFFGLVVATSGYTGDPNVEPQFKAAVEANQRVIGIWNIFAGFIITVLLTQVRKGAKYSRRWTVGVVVITVFVDLIAFTVKAAGVGISLIPILLTIGALLLYRPSVNDFVAYRNDEL